MSQQQNSTLSSSSLETKSFEYDYSDCFTHYLTNTGMERDLDIYDFAEAFFKPPPIWFQFFWNLRDRLVSPFNLKTGVKNKNHDKPQKNNKWEVGSQVGFFKLYEVLGNEMVLGENDKHLDFRVILKYEKVKENESCSVTTLVKYNNSLGKVYFFFVKPFHRLFVPKLIAYNLKKL